MHIPGSVAIVHIRDGYGRTSRIAITPIAIDCSNGTRWDLRASSRGHTSTTLQRRFGCRRSEIRIELCERFAGDEFFEWWCGHNWEIAHHWSCWRPRPRRRRSGWWRRLLLRKYWSRQPARMFGGHVLRLGHVLESSHQSNKPVRVPLDMVDCLRRNFIQLTSTIPRIVIRLH